LENRGLLGSHHRAARPRLRIGRENIAAALFTEEGEARTHAMPTLGGRSFPLLKNGPVPGRFPSFAGSRDLLVPVLFSIGTMTCFAVLVRSAWDVPVVLRALFATRMLAVSDDDFAHFMITGALAQAGAQLVRHWVNPNTLPELLTSDGSMRLRIDRRGSGLRDLRSTVEQLRDTAESLVESCNAWLEVIDKELAREPSRE
jgi:hypothetical protein